MAAHDGASSFSGSSPTYDVFLSFRGDTRNTFTGFLYEDLKRAGINVFMDRENLRVGEEIQTELLHAIQVSKMSIPIFSKCYADSKWCLMELAEIVRCHEFDGQKLLPVFLDVEPRDVRRQTGSFEGPFQKHMEEFDAKTIESWKYALTKAAKRKGRELKEVNGDQPKLVQLIVDWASSELDGNLLDDVTNPIGLDARVEELLSLMNIDLNDVRFVGICGISGVGKTAIAMTLYNRISKSFAMSCFLANVREEALRPHGVISLQEKLIYSVSKKRVKISDIYEGRQLIKKKLQGIKVLLVLDDVDSNSQLEDLAIEFNLFGLGSRIIITSTDEQILNVAKVDGDNIYWPKELDVKQSLQLFSFYAFSSDQPPENYTQLSYDLIQLVGGLPLTLKSWGSSLCGIREKEQWLYMLRNLENFPHREVYRRLKISYDDLEENEKSIFLDAACFLVGWKKETVISIWDVCGFQPIFAIKRLSQKSFLKFTSDGLKTCDDRLRMNNQNQAMGRGIVYEENRREPGERSRLWSHKEIKEVLEERLGSQSIEGILWPKNQSGWSLSIDKKSFAMMSKLRFLYMNGVDFEGDFPPLPSSLKWFSWWGCPAEILPANFYLKRLVYMNLSNSRIIQAWTNKAQSKGQHFQMLKILRLRFCGHLIESPDFSWFPHLETLDLGCCKNMIKLHKSIGDLEHLVKLYLDDTKIKELPDSVCRLSSLQFLTLNSCSSLCNLPESIGDLRSLVTLSLDGTKIEELPNNIGMLSSLQSLTLTWCVSLKNLPDSIGDLRSLVTLCLDGTTIKELPNSICRLSSLQKLNLRWCLLIEKLPDSIDDMTSLPELSICGTKIRRLPNRARWLEKIESFYIGWKGKDF